jgi:hypothetical protein
MTYVSILSVYHKSCQGKWLKSGNMQTAAFGNRKSMQSHMLVRYQQVSNIKTH